MPATKNERGRLSQLDRTCRLISVLLAGRELTRGDIAELLDLKPAAVDRQLDAVGRHLPLVRQKRGGRVFVHLDRSRAIGGVRPPAIGTIIAACLGASLSRLFQGTTYESAMLDVVRRLGSGTRSPERFQNARRQFLFVARGGEKALPEAQGVLDDLIDVMLSGHYIRVRYVGFEGSARTEVLQPLSLAVYEHQLYLLALGDEGGVHPYRFARIRRVTRLPKRFEYPDKDTYEPERVFANSFGVFVDPKYAVERVELSLAPRWTHFVKSHRWHHSQESFTKGNRVHVALTVRFCPEVLAWILSFGPDARVVGPARVRREVAAKVRALALVYGRD